VYHRRYGGEPLLNCVIPGEGKEVPHIALSIVQALVEHGADVNTVGFALNNEGGTALHHAAWTNQPTLVQRLLQHGADPEKRNHDGERALDNAARHGNTEAVQVLIEAGSPYTIFHVVQAGMIHYVAELLRQTPSAVHECNAEGAAPIHHALGPEAHFDLAILAFLIEAGADLQTRDSKGRTALHCALDAEKNEALNAVLAHGGGNISVLW
jgi:ankyrin repeat protein